MSFSSNPVVYRGSVRELLARVLSLPSLETKRVASRVVSGAVARQLSSFP